MNTSIPPTCDVLIIGGGPAGSIAASLLAMKGIDVVVLEKEKFPRYKVGESLIPHFWKYTDAIGASEKIISEGFIQKAGGFVYWEDRLRSVSFKDFGFKRSALHVERGRFDQILLDHASGLGANVFNEVTVTNVQHFESYNLVEYEQAGHQTKAVLKAAYVIDASGQQVVLAKKNQWIEYDQKYKFQSFWAYFDHTSYLNASCQIKSFDERFTDPPMTLISSTGDWGWIWKIMLRDKVSIGAIIPQEHLGRFKAYGSGLEDRFTNYLADAPLISTLTAGSSIVSGVMSVKDYTYRSRHFAFDQCYLIGDAAAFFDPINSEGITMAMYSGYLAAWAIEGSIKRPRRKLFYRDSYIRNMKTRLTLFYLLTYPDKNIPEELLISVRESILQQSDTENYLTFCQLTLTNRGRGFDDILKQYGMNLKQVIRNVEIPDALI